MGIEIYGEVTTGNKSFLEAFLSDPVDKRPSVDGLFDFSIFGGLYKGFCGDPYACGVLDGDGSGYDSGYGGGGGSGSYGSGGGHRARERARRRRLCETPTPQPPNLRELASAIGEKLRWEVSQDVFANFLDTHDEERIVRRCEHDRLRVVNALATLFLLRGVPVIFYGTEQSFAHEDNRHSLWSSNYNTSADMYILIRQLNGLRKRSNLTTAPMWLVGHAQGWMVLCRGEPERRGSIWLFANNQRASELATPLTYCPPQLPILGEDVEWIDELSGQRALLSGGCLHAPDARPKVLVSRSVI